MNPNDLCYWLDGFLQGKVTLAATDVEQVRARTQSALAAITVDGKVHGSLLMAEEHDHDEKQSAPMGPHEEGGEFHREFPGRWGGRGGYYPYPPYPYPMPPPGAYPAPYPDGYYDPLRGIWDAARGIWRAVTR